MISMNIDSDIFSRYLWWFACADERERLLHSVAFHFFASGNALWKPLVRSTLNNKLEIPLGNVVWRLSSLMVLPLAPIFYHDSFQPLLPSARQISAFINKQLRTNASLNNVLCQFSPAALTPRRFSCFWSFCPPL